MENDIATGKAKVVVWKNKERKIHVKTTLKQEAAKGVHGIIEDNKIINIHTDEYTASGDKKKVVDKDINSGSELIKTLSMQNGKLDFDIEEEPTEQCVGSVHLPNKKYKFYNNSSGD